MAWASSSCWEAGGKKKIGLGWVDASSSFEQPLGVWEMNRSCLTLENAQASAPAS